MRKSAVVWCDSQNESVTSVEAFETLLACPSLADIKLDMSCQHKTYELYVVLTTKINVGLQAAYAGILW